MSSCLCVQSKRKKEMKDNVYFVSGIDTNIGKSYATGYLARKWNETGIRTIAA